MAKYSDIDKAKELLVAKTALDNWRDLGREAKIALMAAQKAKTGNKKTAVGVTTGYIRPFGYASTSKIWLKVNLLAQPTGTNLPSEELATTLITKLIGEVYVGSTGTTKYGTTTKPATAGSSITGYQGKNDASKLARVTLRQKGDSLPDKITSRVTGIPYRYTKYDAVSCAFGQDLSTTGIQSFADASSELETFLTDNAPTHSVSFRAQGIITVEVV